MRTIGLPRTQRTDPPVRLLHSFTGTGQHVSDTWPRAERALAVIVAMLIGSRYLVYTQISIGYVAAIALIPLWFPLVRRAPLGRAVFLSGFLALLNGWCLWVAAEAQRPVNNTIAVIVMLELAGVLASAGAMYWVMHRVGLSTAVIAYAVGMLAFVNTRSDLFSTSPWRFGFALPVTILILGLTSRSRKASVGALALIALAAASLIGGARSPIGIQMLALVLLWQWSLRDRQVSHRRSVVGVVVSLGLIAYAVYSLGEALLLEGLLGEGAQQRTEQQIQAAGTVILGGRPELGATAALMAHNPWGFGPGVGANWYDIEVARNGMAALGYDPLNGYVENFMFGDVVRLHSIVGELWAAFGFGGLLVAAAVLWTAVSVLAEGPRGRGDALVLFLTFQTLWNLFFSPWYTSVSVLTLLLPLAWLRAKESGSGLAPGPMTGDVLDPRT